LAGERQPEMGATECKLHQSAIEQRVCLILPFEYLGCPVACGSVVASC
jgi:hypothetical protein